jgi:hypothetical protein
MAQAGRYNAPPNAQTESFYTEMADAFANIAMVATVDKDLLSTLTTTNAALTGQLATKDRLVANIQVPLCNTNTNTKMDRPTTNTNYCWSHGT